MVQVNRAVAVNVDQGAGLVVGGEREGDAEFHRRERDAALQHRRGLVEGGDLLPSLPVGAVGLELGDDLRRDVVFHLLVVRRDVAA